MAWSRVDLGNFAPGVTDYNVQIARVAQNVVPVPGGYKTVRQRQTNNTIVTTTDTLNQVRGFWFMSTENTVVPNLDGYSLVFIRDNSAAPKFYVDGGEFQKTTGLTRSTASFYQVTPIQWDNDLYIFGDVSPPQTITESGLATLGTQKTVDLAGSPPEAEYGALVRQQLVLGRINDGGNIFPNRVRWSAFGDATGWQNGTNQAGQEDLAEGGQISGVVGGEYGVIFQEKGIVRMNYIGAPNVWEFDPISSAPGCSSPRSIVKVGNDIYFWGNDTFYVLRDGSTILPIGVAEGIGEYIRRNVGAANITEINRRIKGAYDPGHGQIWWTFDKTGIGGTRFGASNCMVYDIKTDRWAEIDPDLSGFLGQEWIADVYTRNQLMIDADNKVVPSVGIVIADTFQLLTQEFDGALSLVPEVETGLIFTEGQFSYLRGVRPLSDGEMDVTLFTKNVLDDPEIEGSPVTPNEHGIADLDSEARYHRVKLSGSTSSDFDKLGGLMADTEPAGEY